MPGGLEDFFARIGRPRAEGDTPPAPFPRPENVQQIEAETVFGTLLPRRARASAVPQPVPSWREDPEGTPCASCSACCWP